MADKYYPPKLYQFEGCKIYVYKPILTPEEYEKRHKVLERAVKNMMRPIIFPDTDKT